LGIDVDEKRLMMARESIARNNLQDVMQVRNKDMIEFMKESGEEINNADVIVMYLFRGANLEMATLLQQFKERRRYQSRKVVQILSVGFAMHGWTHIYEEKVAGFRVYLYTT
jgi:ribosomal protein L11 methylase PrmA